MTNLLKQTLANIVSVNHAAAPVLEKYNLDFCCKGKRTLADACSEKGLSFETVLTELESLPTNASGYKIDFGRMDATQLIGYILYKHHFYVKQSMPVIFAHLEKVATKHGKRFPYMVAVFELFSKLKEELTSHMQKEENILFPRIKEIEALYNTRHSRDLAVGYIQAPIEMMEMEHDHAGEIMFRIRELTNNYMVPEDACTTFRLSLAELKAFEEDLHLHVHLENNVLFPMAVQMTKK